MYIWRWQNNGYEKPNRFHTYGNHLGFHTYVLGMKTTSVFIRMETPVRLLYVSRYMGVFENPLIQYVYLYTLVPPCAAAGLSQDLLTLVPARFGTRVARGGVAEGPQDGPKIAPSNPRCL